MNFTENPDNNRQPQQEGQQPVQPEGEYHYTRPQEAQSGYAQTTPVQGGDSQPGGASPTNGDSQPTYNQQPTYVTQPAQPSGKPPKSGLPTGTKVFLGVLAALCCLTLIISVSLAVGSLNGGLSGTGSGAASSVGTQSQPDVSAPQITIEDLVMLEDGENLSPTQAYEKVSVSAVSIKTYVISSVEVYAEGSGMYIEQLSDGALVLTCAHVLEDSYSVTVTDSLGRVFEAELVAKDDSTDLAVLKVNAMNVKVVEFGNGNNTQIGQFVMAIGNPTGDQLASSLTFGVLSGKQRSYSSDSYNTLLQFDAAVNPGNSGGPLINMYGQVIGVVSSKIASLEYEGIGFAIPSDEVLTVVKDLCEYGYVRGRVRLGLSIEQYTEYVVESKKLPGCVGVAGVTAGTDAEKKGIQEGDIIVSIDGEKVTSSDQIIEIVRSHEAGDSVSLVIYRRTSGRAETFTVNVYLYEYKGE